ncbi:MAG: ABC transporter substrate binding protein [Spirochaetales bacterium]|nr:ABC transporter substrate binding protein [Spirochaetales bacterium]
MMRLLKSTFFVLICLGLVFCKPEEQTITVSGRQNDSYSEKPKVLYVDSYNLDYQWSRSIYDGICETLKVGTDDEGNATYENPEILFRSIHMDTKLTTSEDFKINAGIRVRDVIEEWKPDLVICSDDNAAKYVIAPYYMDSDIPFLFCGINHDASEYGFPTKNITGMIEIHDARELAAILRGYAQGNRISYLSGDNLSGRKIGSSVSQQLGDGLRQEYVNSYQEWKERYIALQNETDILLIETPQYFQDWDGNTKAFSWFINANTKIPTGAWDNSLITIALVTLERMGSEQGEWAGRTALSILKGESEISHIPVAQNRKKAIHLNMILAGRLGIRFPMKLIEISHISNEMTDVRKVLFIDSYHEGYVWSDDVVKGFIKALSRTEQTIDLEILRMNTKINTSEDYILQKAVEIKEFIELWQPDVVIGSDDNFTRYVLVPYFKDAETPFLFCGINWDAAEYGLPFSNTSGMIEIDPLDEAVAFLSGFSAGDRVAFIGNNSYYVKKLAWFSQDRTGVSYNVVHHVETFEEWKKAYLSVQDESDMLILSSPEGLKGFNEKEALEFIYRHARIPSSVTVGGEVKYALTAVSKVAEEQGWWAGSMALEILDGRPVNEIPVTVNQKIKTQLNMDMARHLGIKIPPEIIRETLLWSAVEDQ